eukprot:COSAG02_NODE_5912_length_3942_cov_2.628676_1_plen_110_part_00
MSLIIACMRRARAREAAGARRGARTPSRGAAAGTPLVLRDTSTSTRDSIRMSSYVKSVANITLTGAKLLVEAAEAKATEMVILDQGCSSFKALLARTSSAKINYRVRTG